MSDESRSKRLPGATSQVPVLYLEGLLTAIPHAVSRLVAFEACWVIEAPPGHPLRVLAGPDRGCEALDEAVVREAIRSGAPQLREPGSAATAAAVLAVPLAFELAPRYCLCCQLTDAAPPDWQDLARSVAEVAGAGLEAVWQLRGMIEQASEGIVVCDPAGNYLDVNRATCEITGYSAEELLRLNYHDLLSEAEKNGQPVRYEQLRQGETVRTERTLVRNDGQEVIVELSGKQISGGRFLALVRDVSARHETEIALRESEERYRALTNATFDAICLHDNSVLFEANQPFADGLGYELQELVGMHLQQIIAPQQWPLVRALAEQGYGRPYETVVLHKDGSRIHVEICARSVRYQGRVVRLVAARDISERKLAELELLRISIERKELAARVIAAQESERIALARELHDHIGQMLAVLKMEADWLAQRAGSPADVTSVAARIDDKVGEMLTVVRKLAHRLRPAVLDDLGIDCALESLIDEIAQHSEIGFDTEISACCQLPREVTTALYRIAQEALANLVRHGCATRCSVRLRDENSRVRLQIEHDGVEVSPAALEDRRSLGIASMRERAQLLDGEFSISARDGGGTRLSTAIPYPTGSSSR